MIIDFIHSKSYYTIGKSKNKHSYNQTMISLFSFITLVRARVTLLHFKEILIKDMLTNCSQINLTSSKIHATSEKQLISKFKRSTNNFNKLIVNFEW